MFYIIIRLRRVIMALPPRQNMNVLYTHPPPAGGYDSAPRQIAAGAEY